MNSEQNFALSSKLSDLAHRIRSLEELLHLQAPNDTKPRAELKAGILKLLQEERRLRRELQGTAISGQV
jgi:hypothetical protein